MSIKEFIKEAERQNEESRKALKEHGKKAREHHENFIKACG